MPVCLAKLDAAIITINLRKDPLTYAYSQGIHIDVCILKVPSGKDQQVYYYYHCHRSIDSDHNWNHAEVPVYRVTT